MAEGSERDQAELDRLRVQWEEDDRRFDERTQGSLVATAAPAVSATGSTDSASLERTIWERIPGPVATVSEPVAPIAEGDDSLSTIASRPGMAALPYWLAIIVIMVCEVPFNAVAFRVLREPNLMTYVITFAVALGLVLIAHLFGIFASKVDPRSFERVLAVVFAAVPLGAIVAIAVVREAYVRRPGANDLLGPVRGSLAFGCINLLVFAVAGGLSYVRHDPESEVNLRRARRRSQSEMRRTADRERRRREAQRKRVIEEAKHDVEVLQATRRRDHDDEVQRIRDAEEAEARRIQQARASAAEERRAELERRDALSAPIIERERRREERAGSLEGRRASTEGHEAELRERLAATRAARKQRWRAARARAMSVRQHFVRVMHAYCAANVQARKDHQAPPVFASLPAIALPPDFDRFDDEGE